jgi:arylsulfatase A-like enzyme
VLWGSPGVDIGDTVTGQVRSQPVTLLDVAPTLAGLAGLDRAPSFLGRELTGALPEDHAVFLQRRNYRSRMVRGREVRGALTAVVAQGHKYLATVSGEQSSTAELYHLADDPGELDDLSASRPGLSLRLARLLSGWESEYAAVKTVPVSDREVIKALRSLGYVE